MTFRFGCTPEQALAHLKEALAAMEKAENCAVLWFDEIRNRGLYRQLGYSSMNQFAEVELNFSRTKTGDFLRLSAKLDQLPVLRQSLTSGKVGYSKAVEIIKVATPKTEENWVQAAQKNSRNALRKQVQKVQNEVRRRKNQPSYQLKLENPQPTQSPPDNPSNEPDKPTPPKSPSNGEGHVTIQPDILEIPQRWCVDLSPDQLSRLEAIEERLRKLGRPTSGKARAEILLDGLDALANELASPEAQNLQTTTDCEEKDCNKSARRRAPHQPPAQIHVIQCPDCSQTNVTTSRGELPIRKSTLDRLQCDARIHQPGKPNRATIPPSIRHQALTRDRSCCQAPGCRHTHHLEIHHITPRNKGGSNKLENLITLCRGCHQILHEKGRLKPSWLHAGKKLDDKNDKEKGSRG